MYEMLGNQFFLARKFSQAADNLKKALEKCPDNKIIQRKLVICYSQTGQVQRALDVFLNLIKKDIEFLIQTDPVDDDCPCPEITHQMEKKYYENKDSLEYQLVLGMLWLYCSVGKSLHYFQIAQEMAPDHQVVNSIIKIIENYHLNSKPN
jgi:tetratricopeptide (TPR) repeat protein